MSRVDFACQVLSEYAEATCLAGIQPEPGGRLSLTLGEILVTFSYREKPVEALSIHVDLGPVPEQDAAVPGSQLALNFQTWLANNMTIALDEATGRAIGWNAIPISGPSAEILREVTDGMLTVALRVRDALDRPDMIDAAADESPARRRSRGSPAPSRPWLSLQPGRRTPQIKQVFDPRR